MFKTRLDWLYPAVDAYRTDFLDVGDRHQIYFEESGNPKGKPVVFLHGGPGGGTSPEHRRFFNPQKYRIVLFDQRGCGKSKPHASLENNTTWDLVSDIEKLREHLDISKWQVFGGSWGSTLALAYAETHPARVSELVLRGIFLLRKKELDWFYQDGASKIYPDAYQTYRNFIPKDEQDDLLKAYHKRLIGEDQKTKIEAAKRWSIWEASTSYLFQNEKAIAEFEKDETAEAFARIETHYFVNAGFLETENYLIENVGKIRNIPGVIVQGRYDVVCPMDSAWELKQAWPEVDLLVVQDAGHSAFEMGIARGLVAATDRFSDMG